jgi:hypothetical protein
MAETKKLNMKSKILSLLGIGAIAFAVACNSSGDETTNADSASAASNTAVNAGGSGSASIQTTSDGKRYVLRTRTGTSSTSTGTTSSGTSEYDTVWLWGTEDRYYTIGGTTGRDTLYFDSDDWKTWWSNPETDNELKSKSGSTKVKIDEDGSWKVKDSASKVKMNDKGKVKSKPKG